MGRCHAATAAKLAFALGFLVLSVSGCYKEQPASGTIDLSEVPEAVALLVPAEGLAIDFGPTPLQTSRDLTIHVVNSGPYAATEFRSNAELEAPFSYKGGAFPGTGGTCSTEVAPSGNCTLVLTYSPETNGPHAGTAKMDYVNGVLVFPLEIGLVGTTAATLSFSDAGLIHFGMKAIGSATDKLVTVTNSGSLPAENLDESLAEALAAPFSFSGGAYPGTNGNCGALLAPDENCTIDIRFEPVAAGNFTDNVVLSFETGGLPQESSLTLDGQTPALLQISDGATFDFKRHVAASSTDKTLTLTNIGGVPATAIQESVAEALLPPFSLKGGIFPGTDGTCTASIAPGASCTLVAVFAPAQVPSNDASDELTIEYHDGVALTDVTRNLSGRGQFGWDGSAAGSPGARHRHSAVWTGTHMIVWGGHNGSEPLSDGAKYEPEKDTWTSISATSLMARSRHTAVWADNLSAPKMIIWGGQRDNGAALASGAMYNPALDQWTDISTAGAPSARYGHTAIWDPIRRKMIVWGGADATVHFAARGYLFDPDAGAGGTWTQIPDALAGTPLERYHHSAVWTGSQMIVWGGCLAKNGTDTCTNETDTGAIFDPGNSSWTTFAAVGAPAARFLHSAIWTGSEMVIWGGATDSNGAGNLVLMDSGGIYTPPSGGESWAATPAALGVPAARAGHLGFWTTQGMVIWGGVADSGDGALLNPALAAWTALPAGAPGETSGTAGVYTGGTEARVLVFGGMGAGPGASSVTGILVP